MFSPFRLLIDLSADVLAEEKVQSKHSCMLLDATEMTFIRVAWKVDQDYMKDVGCTTLHRIVSSTEHQIPSLVSQSIRMIASAFLDPLHSPRITRILQLISLHNFDKQTCGGLVLV